MQASRGRSARTLARRLAFSLLLCASGCGTVTALSEPGPGYGRYEGVLFDVFYPVFAASRGSAAWLLLYPLALVDLPLSFVADTLLLPYVAYREGHPPERTAAPEPETAAPAPREETRHFEEPTVAAAASSTVLALALSPDGTRLAFSGDSGVDARSVAPVASHDAFAGWHSAEPACALAWSRDGALLAAATSSGDVHVLRARDGESVDFIPSFGKSIDYAPNGCLVGVTDDLALHFWDPATKKVRVVAPYDLGDRTFAARLAVSPDGSRVAVLGTEPIANDANRELQVFDLQGLTPVFRRVVRSAMASHHGGVAFSRDGSLIVFADSELQILDTATLTLRSENEGAQSVAFAPDGHAIAVGKDYCVHILTSRGSRRIVARLNILRTFSDAAGVAFSNDGRRVFAAINESVLVWELPEVGSSKGE
jgi:uncharacterized protein YceK